jgi:hypothetical protein
MTIKEELLDQGYRVALIVTNTPDTSDVPLVDLAVPEGAIADPVPEMDDELGCKGVLDLGAPGGERPLIMSMAMYRQWCEALAHNHEGTYQAMERAIAAPTVKERLLAAGYRVVVSYYPPECAGGGEPLPLVEVDIPEGTLVTLAEPEYHGGLLLLIPGWDPEDAPVAMTLGQYHMYCDATCTDPEDEYQWMAGQVGE